MISVTGSSQAKGRERMEVLWKLLEDILFVVENVSVCHVVLKQPWGIKGKKKRLWGLAGLALVYYILWFSGSESKILGIAVILWVFFYLFGLSFFRIVAVYIASALFATLLEAAVNVHHTDNLRQTEVIWVTIAVIAVVWLYHIVIGRRLDEEIFQFPLFVWGIMSGILFVFMLLIILLQTLVIKYVEKESLWIFKNILIGFGGITVCGLMIAMAYWINKTLKYKFQKEIAEIYNEQQKEYFQRLLEKEQETRQFRHDIIGHLVAVEKLCADDRTEKAKEYVSTLLAGVSSISRAQYNVGNETVNVIINYYFVPVKEKCEIHVSGNMGDELEISPNDLCVLVSNLAKNAVEAVMQMPEEERKIRFKVSQGREYLNMCMENTYSGKLLADRQGKLKTTKSDTVNHGYGMKSIAGITEKYEGKYEIKQDKNLFAMEVYLKTGKANTKINEIMTV